MTIAETVSELLFAGKTRREVAGYDDRFMVWVLGRPRDARGRLSRGEALPPGVEVDADGMRVVRNPVPYAKMYQGVMGRRGLSPDEVRERWERWQKDNPKAGKGG